MLPGPLCACNIISKGETSITAVRIGEGGTWRTVTISQGGRSIIISENGRLMTEGSGASPLVKAERASSQYK